MRHFSEATARSGLAACLQSVQARDVNLRHHRLVRKYFDPDVADPAWPEQLQFFLDGARREDLPAIMSEACKMAFIAVTERSIECRHATAATKVKLIKKLRPSGFSLRLRASELHQRYLVNPESIDFLLRKVIHAREEGFLQVTGLAKRPTTLSTASERNGRLKLADHCDLETTMRARASAPGTSPQDGPAKLLQHAVRDAPNEASRKQVMLRRLMQEHFQSMLGEGALFCCRANVAPGGVPLSRRTSSLAASHVHQGREIQDGQVTSAGAFASCFAQVSQDASSAFHEIQFGSMAPSVVQVFSERLAPNSLGVNSRCYRVVKSHPSRQKQLHSGPNKSFASFDVGFCARVEMCSFRGGRPHGQPCARKRGLLWRHSRILADAAGARADTR